VIVDELFLRSTKIKDDEEVVLKRWQKSVLNLMKSQDDRQVLWIKDDVGNSGKSVLATYLMRTGKSFVVEGGSTRDLSYDWWYGGVDSQHL
jgi:hypothetical protein